MSPVIGRTKLPDRRFSVTQSVEFEQSSGKKIKVLVTFSFDKAKTSEGEPPRIREVFTADFKAGSDTQTIIIDACILASLLLQHGRTIDLLLGSLSEPRSLIGAILEAAKSAEEEMAKP